MLNINRKIIACATFLIILLNANCGPSAREKAIHTTFVSVNAARDGFLAWDKQHQLDLVKAAPSLPEGAKALDVYRHKRMPVVESFSAAYYAMSVALMVNNAKTLNDLLNAAKILKTDLESLMKP